jgi:type IV secretion system protein VirB2
MKARSLVRRYWKPVAAGVALGVVTLWADPALASSAGGSLPWDTPLTTLKNDLTGPVAFVISLLAMVACGAALVFGGEMNEFVRRMILLVLVCALITGVVNVASALGITGAVV